MKALRDSIPDEQLAGHGREEQGHITVRYGLLDNDVDGIRQYFQSLAPVHIGFGTVKVFEPTVYSDGAAVVHVAVISSDLENINAALAECGKFKDADFVYHAHATLAYIDSKFTGQWEGNQSLDGESYLVDQIAICSKDDDAPQEIVQLCGDAKAVAPAAKLAKSADDENDTPPLLASPRDDSEAARLTRRRIREQAEAAISELAAANIDAIVDAYSEGQTPDDVVNVLDMGPLDRLADSLPPILRNMVQDAGLRALEALKIDDAGIVDLVNKDAIDYATARAAELVGRKWIDGELIDNPNARWAITESTRDGVRELVAKSYEDGVIPRDLAKELRASYDFSKRRADLIARTETSKASVSGTLVAWRRSGVVTHKIWILSDDHSIEDECDLNEGDGPLGLDEEFSGGVDGPPQHPGCWCSVAARMIGQE